LTEPVTTTAHRICPLCEACCGLELTLTSGRVTAIRGHEADVFSRGYICPKAVALKDLHEDPDRLRAPLVKRDGKFVEVSWDEAFAEIERRLPPIQQRYGRDAVAAVFGNPSVHKAGLILYVPRLARALGTRNLYSASTIDQMPKQLSSGLMFGEWLSIPVPDIERTDLLVVLGANPIVSNGSLWTVPDFRGKAKALRARGGRLVVIDPRRNETAEVADQFHFIRPGADAFLLAGIVATLFQENLVQLGRLAGHVNGLEELAPLFQPFAPERVAARCGIEAHAIRDLARALAKTERAALYGRLGTCTQEFGTLTSWLVDVINALTRHLDEPGGAMFPRAAAFAKNTLGAPGKGRGVGTGRHKSRVSGAPEVFGELPLTCLAEEIETPGTGQVRALITLAGNPVLSAPNGARLGKAFEQLEFMVSVDLYLNETTRFADVILPGSSPLEDLHYDTAFPQFGWRNTVRATPAVFSRPAGQPAEWEILLRMAAIMTGRGAKADVAELDDELTGADVQRTAGDHSAAVMNAISGRRGPERLIDLALRAGPYGDRFGLKPDGLNLTKVLATPGGVDFGPLAPRIPEMLRTPSGHVELAPPALVEDLARAAKRLDDPAPDLVVVGRRQVRSNNSWMHNLPTLAKGRNRCTLLVHPTDAQRFGLTDGGRARVTGKSNGGHAVEAQVEISDAMMPGVISLPHGWGHDLPETRLNVAAVQPGANLNAVLDESVRDPLSGNAVLSGVPVAVCAA
jgi:anaerobic selenocysteine-containing dehydrogenase